MSRRRNESTGCSVGQKACCQGYLVQRKIVSLDNRFIPPVFITLILLVGNLSYGILESWKKTLLAIAASMIGNLCWDESSLVSRPIPRAHILRGESALVSSCDRRSIGRLHCGLTSITSKYVSALEGSPHMEPIQLWNFCFVIPGGRSQRQPQHPVGKLPSTHDHHLDPGKPDHASCSPF